MAALVHGCRKFYDIPSEELPRSKKDKQVKVDEQIDKLLQYIEDNCIGNDTAFSGPYGRRKVVYCDYTASGRSLQFIEDYIRDQVLPHYGNTHTTTTVTSLQTTLYRHEARDIIRNAVNAGEGDAVIFTGSGCTAAVHKLIHSLNLTVPPVVFIGPFEHHSNLLPWKEAGAEIIWIAQDSCGLVDINDLTEKLKKSSGIGRQLIGCFAAASNVTGILVDVNAITACLHRHGALAIWDYATSGPYTEINMNPLVTSTDQSLVYKDAIFISTHKFIGGVGTPGILIAKKKLFNNPVPSGGGGGTVFFVTENTHRYLQEIEMREEGGTPAIVESIRAGLVFQLKEAVGHDAIMRREEQLCREALQAWSKVENLVLLGNTALPRLPIFSFLVHHPASGLFLHHNYVCALLNDLFGIQARGGCACAGPYAQNLLGMDEALAQRFESLLLEDSRLDRVHLRRYSEYSEHEILRPGFVRLNLPYFMSSAHVTFVIKAVTMVSELGWKLLPQYMFNPETGEWKHRRHKVFQDRKWLGSISYSTGQLSYPTVTGDERPSSLQECLSKAEEVFQNAAKNSTVIGDHTLLLGDEGERLRWFLLPSEAGDVLTGKLPAHLARLPPFMPKNWGNRRDFPGNGDRERGKSNVENVNGANYPKEDDSVAENGISGYETKTNCRLNKRGNIVTVTSDEDSLVGQEVHRACCPENKTSKLNGANHESVASQICSTVQSNENETHDNSSTHKGNSSSCENDQTCTEQSSKSRSECLTCLRPRETPSGTNTKRESAKDTGITKPKFHHPPKCIFKPTVEAIEEYSMICDGDRVLVCLSGGKDSLSLLHSLNQYKYQARAKGISFELGAVTVDPQSSGYEPRPLIPYLAALDVPYFFEEQDIIQQASQLPVCESICSFCSRMKRGRLYACARREGYNVLAMGQHLDDLAESEEDLRIIRPFVYAREKDLREFASAVKLPVIAENCPACFESPKERHRTKQLLAAQEILFPGLYPSLLTAMKPLMARNRVGMESSKMKSKEFDDFL